MITTLIGYFVAGAFICAGVAVMNRQAGNWHGWGSIGYLLVLLPLWPFFSIGFLKWALQPTKTRCAWCGNIAHSDEEVKTHIMTCKLHPMRLEIEAAKAESDGYAEALDIILGNLDIDWWDSEPPVDEAIRKIGAIAAVQPTATDE